MKTKTTFKTATLYHRLAAGHWWTIIGLALRLMSVFTSGLHTLWSGNSRLLDSDNWLAGPPRCLSRCSVDVDSSLAAGLRSKSGSAPTSWHSCIAADLSSRPCPHLTFPLGFIDYIMSPTGLLHATLTQTAGCTSTRRHTCKCTHKLYSVFPLYLHKYTSNALTGQLQYLKDKDEALLFTERKDKYRNTLFLIKCSRHFTILQYVVVCAVPHAWALLNSSILTQLNTYDLFLLDQRSVDNRIQGVQKATED